MVYETTLKKHGTDSTPKPVIVKKLTDDDDVPASVRKEFINEMQALKEIDCPNIVRMIAVVSLEQPYQMIFEGMTSGNLKTYLIAARNGTPVPPRTIMEFATDIAYAMLYLSNLKIIHNDVAARNCYVDGNTQCKLGDFGLSNTLFPADYFVVFPKQPAVPLRWMAPERLRREPATTKSDVWYGRIGYANFILTLLKVIWCAIVGAVY